MKNGLLFHSMIISSGVHYYVSCDQTSSSYTMDINKKNTYKRQGFYELTFYIYINQYIYKQKNRNII